MHILETSKICLNQFSMFLEFHNPCFFVSPIRGKRKLPNNRADPQWSLLSSWTHLQVGGVDGLDDDDDDDDDDAFMHANCVVLLDWIAGLEARLTKDPRQQSFFSTRFVQTMSG